MIDLYENQTKSHSIEAVRKMPAKDINDMFGLDEINNLNNKQQTKIEDILNMSVLEQIQEDTKVEYIVEKELKGRYNFIKNDALLYDIQQYTKTRDMVKQDKDNIKDIEELEDV